MFLSGLSNINLINSHMLFFKSWFSPKSTKNYFPLIQAAVFMGIGFGSLIPFAFISDTTKDYDEFLK